MCAYAWTSCLLRAIRLREAVSQYSDEHPGSRPPATPVTATTATSVTAMAGEGPVSATATSTRPSTTGTPVATMV